MNALTTWLDENFQEIDPYTFYRGIFPTGELDQKDAYTKGKYTGIIITVSRDKQEDGERKVKRYTLTDELDAVEVVCKTDDFCLCAPISYAGRSRKAENARMMYAIAIDVDKLIFSKSGSPDGLRSLWKQVKNGHLPKPTYIVSSGTGLHLYYVLDKPVPLYKEYATELQKQKRALTSLVWNGAIVSIKSEKEIQQEGIYQGFRMPGTVTKLGNRVLAYKTGESVTLDYLNGFVEEHNKATKAAKQSKRGTVNIDEAAKRWPEWYERRIVNGGQRGAIPFSRSVYEWWLKQIYNGAFDGNRYHCVMMLAVYAEKCGIYDAKRNPHPVTQEELERDAYGLVEYLDGLTETSTNHFGVDDVQDALEAYQEKSRLYTRAKVTEKTSIQIPPQKKNYRKQDVHLRIARNTLEILNEENGEPLQGRKRATLIVEEWRKKNPKGTKADCIRATGLDKKTVYKWWEGDNHNNAKTVAPVKQMASNQQMAFIADEIRTEQLALAGELHSNWKVLYTNLKSMQITMDTMRGLAGLLQEGEEKKNLMDMLNKTNNDYCAGVESMKNTIEMMERLAATLPECEEKQKFVAIYENAREGYRELIERVNR